MKTLNFSLIILAAALCMGLQAPANAAESNFVAQGPDFRRGPRHDGPDMRWHRGPGPDRPDMRGPAGDRPHRPDMRGERGPRPDRFDGHRPGRWDDRHLRGEGWKHRPDFRGPHGRPGWNGPKHSWRSGPWHDNGRHVGQWRR